MLLSLTPSTGITDGMSRRSYSLQADEDMDDIELVHNGQKLTDATRTLASFGMTTETEAVQMDRLVSWAHLIMQRCLPPNLGSLHNSVNVYELRLLLQLRPTPWTIWNGRGCKF